ncbi:MAG TPA: hypothetical protein VGG85_13550 [Terracidiphilus sp.]
MQLILGTIVFKETEVVKEKKMLSSELLFSATVETGTSAARSAAFDIEQAANTGFVPQLNSGD